jgi:hypothetical protein
VASESNTSKSWWGLRSWDLLIAQLLRSAKCFIRNWGSGSGESPHTDEARRAGNGMTAARQFVAL